MIISKKYLSVFTSESAAEKQVTAKDKNGNLLFNLQIRPDKTGMPFYLDVERLKGKDVFFYCEGNEFCFDGETDSISSFLDNSQSLRPLLHYTVPYGWLNDPNGLIFYEGNYHIFCQHNPLGTSWGNMHWHHSVTKDFIHFEHLGDALFPDETGTMFSGSAICDKNNVSGLGKNALLLYYTIAEYSGRHNQPEFSQGLAYSLDGMHFSKYKGNPVVPNIKGENRDPRVVFVPEINAYVMALYLEGDEYCLLKSDNLLNWKLFQRINIKSDGECPDLYYLSDGGKWILSGASDYYIVGHFEKCGFVPEQEPLRFYTETDGRHSYAAQSFSGTDTRVMRLSWENINPGDGQRFCGQLSVPMEMSLVTLPDGKMRLKASLCKELESKLVPCKKSDGEYLIESGAYVADFYFDESFTADIDGASLRVNVSNNTVSLGGNTVPLSLSGEKNLRLVVDTMSIEILADSGLIFSCVKNICKSGTRRLKIQSGNVETVVSYISKY
ncbi:MAG: glycoside hydrolase family 32 protein [Clostridia bacterium]|nr:glycoside hydrolase family 32 protein [Clostridia bacterium]